MERYEVGRLLGEGTYGTVMAATERATGIKVALKYIEMKPTEGVPPTTLRETSILKKLRHPNVVTLYEVMNMGNKLVLVFERLDFDLKTFLDKHRRFEPCNHFIIMSSSNTKHDFKKKGCPICAQPVANVSNNLEESTVMFFMWQILTGIAYVHAQDVIHRDVKPQNLLIARTLPSLKTSSESKASSSSSDSKDVKNLDPKTAINSSSSVTVGAKSSPSSAQILAVGGGWETATLKWADFGLSRTMNIPLKSLTDDVVTLWYRPPEVLLGSQQYDNKIDLWSVGCVFAELITGEALFTGQEKEDQLKAIFSTVGMPTVENWPGWRSIGESSQKKTYTGNYNRKRTLQDVVKPLSKSGMDLLLRLLEVNPAKRISAREALAHEYFNVLQTKMESIGISTATAGTPGIGVAPLAGTSAAAPRMIRGTANTSAPAPAPGPALAPAPAPPTAMSGLPTLVANAAVVNQRNTATSLARANPPAVITYASKVATATAAPSAARVVTSAAPSLPTLPQVPRMHGSRDPIAPTEIGTRGQAPPIGPPVPLPRSSAGGGITLANTKSR